MSTDAGAPAALRHLARSCSNCCGLVQAHRDATLRRRARLRPRNPPAPLASSTAPQTRCPIVRLLGSCRHLSGITSRYEKSTYVLDDRCLIPAYPSLFMSLNFTCLLTYCWLLQLPPPQIQLPTQTQQPAPQIVTPAPPPVPQRTTPPPAPAPVVPPAPPRRSPQPPRRHPPPTPPRPTATSPADPNGNRRQTTPNPSQPPPRLDCNRNPQPPHPRRPPIKMPDTPYTPPAQNNQSMKRSPSSGSNISVRQDSNVSSDSFSQTSSPSYTTKTMEAPLLPHQHVNKSLNAKIAKGLLLKEQQEKEAGNQSITKSMSTPASLQTIVRFQNGSNMSLHHRVSLFDKSIRAE